MRIALLLGLALSAQARGPQGVSWYYDAETALRVAERTARPVVVLDAASSVNGFGQNQDRAPRAYPRLLEARPGPHTKETARALLARHLAPRSPGTR